MIYTEALGRSKNTFNIAYLNMFLYGQIHQQRFPRNFSYYPANFENITFISFDTFVFRRVAAAIWLK